MVLAVPPVAYIVGATDGRRYSIEIEPEVRLWLVKIPAQHYKQAERVADLLAEQAEAERAHVAQRLCEAEHQAAAEHASTAATSRRADESQ